MKKVLLLENGMRFVGESFGSDHDVIAEIVFNTAMNGYLETITDPGYFGQAVVQTFPLIGNYGFIPQDLESSAPLLSAYIVRDYCTIPSNFRSRGLLTDFLADHNIAGLSGIDTRALTRVLREHGTMNGIITADPDNVDMTVLAAYKVQKAVESVSAKEISCHGEGGKYRVVLLDCGVRANVVKTLTDYGCEVWVCPHDTSAAKLLSLNPHGIVLSNGPGNPKDNQSIINVVGELQSSRIPIFAYGLGHQLLALANGFDTCKLKYGHRGANQPVQDESGKVHITAQNHGYAVLSESVKKDVAKEIFVNLNDKTNEGLLYNNIPAFSVQMQPESCGGPLNPGMLFERFISMMEENNAIK